MHAQVIDEERLALQRRPVAEPLNKNQDCNCLFLVESAAQRQNHEVPLHGALGPRVAFKGARAQASSRLLLLEFGDALTPESQDEKHLTHLVKLSLPIVLEQVAH